MNIKTPTRFASTLVAAALVAALAACSSTPMQNAALEEARAAYGQASTDPTVTRVAVRELQQAEQALARANGAFKSGADKSEVDHLAYLARQRTAVAMQTGRIADTDKTIADTKAQRDRLVIDSRTREADAQRNEAEAQRAEAERARLLAEQRLAVAEAARRQAEASRGRADSLEAQLAELKAKETERGMVLTLGDVLFDTGQATLKAGAIRTIDQLATFLTNNPTRKVSIEGYTDSVGSDSYNQQLSQRRADAVRAALAQRGVGGDRIETHGMGENYSVATNDTAEGRQLNRRVEVVFSDDRGGFKARRE